MYDVDVDENCGYHAVTEQLGIFETAVSRGMTPCRYARMSMSEQLVKNRSFYEQLVGHGDGFDNMYAQVLGPEQEMEFLPSQYWMKMPLCGHLVADTFNCVVHYITPTVEVTFTPKWKKCEGSLKKRIVVLAFVNGNHFVIPKLEDNCPLPPVCGMVKNKDLDPNIWKGWMKLYEENHQFLDALALSKKPLQEEEMQLNTCGSDDE
ncbi:uncharacterized protein LOC113350920 [Papaver somniferum]|uniref:uncharacterized protein LOC113350920 n=1 Tax=Papaver somniferum TaxID=3469 RepID=UPI000E704BD0|nr:uncharacterized protein LOC113350920 [Papaver somniferum]